MCSISKHHHHDHPINRVSDNFMMKSSGLINLTQHVIKTLKPFGSLLLSSSLSLLLLITLICLPVSIEGQSADGQQQVAIGINIDPNSLSDISSREQLDDKILSSSTLDPTSFSSFSPSSSPSPLSSSSQPPSQSSSTSSSQQQVSSSSLSLLSSVLSSFESTSDIQSSFSSLLIAPSSINSLTSDLSLSSSSNVYSNRTSSVHRLSCKDGLVLPVWRPLENLSSGDVIVRGLLYFFSLVYLFVGVSIIADKFMAAIEVITSQERDVKIKKANGEYQVISVRIWNETVSNLTLMALGSSAPEILLSIIEVYAQNYEAGELGPGTIVGSAAFNMFVIIAVCVWVVPSTEVKKIKHLRVFFVTMVWSVFAYIWLFIILSVISPGIVDLWEAFLTFAFFPATVLTAWIADRRLLIYKYLSKNYRMNRRGVIVQGEGGDGEDVEMGDKMISNHIDDQSGLTVNTSSNHHHHHHGGMFKVTDEDIEVNEDAKEFEEHRREFIGILRELRKKHPEAPMEDIEYMAREEIINRGPKSRAFYRLQVKLDFLSLSLSNHFRYIYYMTLSLRIH